MGLMDELKQERFGPPNKCSLARILTTMTDQDSQELAQAVNDGVIPATVISRVLERRGISLAAHAIQRHRRKECGCAQ